MEEQPITHIEVILSPGKTRGQYEGLHFRLRNKYPGASIYTSYDPLMETSPEGKLTVKIQDAELKYSRNGITIELVARGANAIEELRKALNDIEAEIEGKPNEVD